MASCGSAVVATVRPAPLPSKTRARNSVGGSPSNQTRMMSKPSRRAAIVVLLPDSRTADYVASVTRTSSPSMSMIFTATVAPSGGAGKLVASLHKIALLVGDVRDHNVEDLFVVGRVDEDAVDH